jgi:hypothetical protein
MRRRLGKWLKDQNNRDIAKMAAAALAALAAAIWTVFTFAVERPAAPGISANSGAVAAGRDASGNTITYTAPAPPAVKP